MTMKGGCLCGAVRYSTESAPLFVGNCYCEDCRRTAGTSRSTVFGVPEAAVQITGTLSTYTKRSDHESDVTRAFCPTCGSPIYSASSGQPGVLIMKAGSLDDINSVQPMVAVYAANAPAWDKPAEGVMAFAKMPPRG